MYKLKFWKFQWLASITVVLKECLLEAHVVLFDPWLFKHNQYQFIIIISDFEH